MKKSPGRAQSALLDDLVIEEIGARGDGIGKWNGVPVFVPFTAPGDRIAARSTEKRGDGIAARIERLIAPGPGRVEPPCRHFTECGGCAVQHLDFATAAAWKQEILGEALRRAGFDKSLVAPLIRIPPGSRRRADLTFERRRGSVILGLAARASHRIIDLIECPVLAAPLVQILAPLRALLAKVIPSGGSGRLAITLTDSGLDLLIESQSSPGLEEREILARFAEQHDLARLSWGDGKEDTQPIARRRAALVHFAGIPVEPPPGGFLQPSKDGESAITGLIEEAFAGAQSVADLYAGSGSLTFPVARKAKIHAVEGDVAALAALRSAHDRDGGRSGLRITTEHRDLARRPLLGKELSRFDAVMFDPPRAGAAEQAEMLAASGPALVAAISCNPATLARDARLLAGGGYRLIQATPIDQFPWSSQLEAVAIFRR